MGALTDLYQQGVTVPDVIKQEIKKYLLTGNSVIINPLFSQILVELEIDGTKGSIDLYNPKYFIV